MNQSNNNSRRDFVRQSAVLGAGAALAGSSNLVAEKSSGYGNGPYPTEGMTGYSETSPVKVMKFQRHAIGPKDVAIKDFCAIQNIKPQITKIPMDGINDAWSKVIAKQARYRFVMDMGVRS